MAWPRRNEAPDARALVLEDRAAIEVALVGHGLAPSEHCFANLFLFRGRHAYRLHREPVPYLRGTTYDGLVHALPLVAIDALVLAAIAQTQVDCIFPLGADVVERALPDGWSLSFVDADSDYWYDGAAMSQMDFTKARRAQGVAFGKESQPVFEPWGPGSDEAARDVLQGWLSDVGREIADTDYAECSEAISCAEALGLRGSIVRTGRGRPVGFVLGTRREDGVDVIHFAKGRRAHTGVYPWMFARFAAVNHSRLLNFEQDLGNPGLAQSKRAYRPIERRSKWRLVPPRL